LIPAAAAVVPPAPAAEPERAPKRAEKEEEYDADSVFAKLKGLKAPSEYE